MCWKFETKTIEKVIKEETTVVNLTLTKEEAVLLRTLMSYTVSKNSDISHNLWTKMSTIPFVTNLCLCENNVINFAKDTDSLLREITGRWT